MSEVEIAYAPIDGGAVCMLWGVIASRRAN